ncbi:MAG TPA: histidine kinase dimerization/phospho-acceptor domain-containing protein [Actinomycetota bacterium]|nr:histidine kinase dimerization/phospho-acceptor domain-containing protein [Actinomycetota bacterium]
MHRDQVRHELRTPLTVIKGVLRLLEQQAADRLPSDIKRELIERANQQVTQLELAIEQIESQFSDSPEQDVIVLFEETV